MRSFQIIAFNYPIFDDMFHYENLTMHINFIKQGSQYLLHLENEGTRAFFNS